MDFTARMKCRSNAVVTMLLLLFMASPIGAQEARPAGVDWSLIKTITSRIESPHIPTRVYRVADFGADGDGTADARPAVLVAAAKASVEGGGRVVLENVKDLRFENVTAGGQPVLVSTVGNSQKPTQTEKEVLP